MAYDPKNYEAFVTAPYNGRTFQCGWFPSGWECGYCRKYVFDLNTLDGDHCLYCRAKVSFVAKPIFNFPPPGTASGKGPGNYSKYCSVCGDLLDASGYCPACKQYTRIPFYRPSAWSRNRPSFTSPTGPSTQAPPQPQQVNTNTGGFNMSSSIKIWWDQSAQAYFMVTPYNKTFVETLKMLAPASDRIWDNDKKSWMISERIVAQVKDLAEKTFRASATFISKQQAQTASAPPRVTNATPLDKLMLDFFRLLPYTAARRAYQTAALELHPDKGGSLEKMTLLNAAWSRIEKEHFKVGVSE